MQNLSLCNDIKQIAAPLFDVLKINYLGYGRAYTDGTIFDISTSATWVEHFINEKYEGIGFTGKSFSSGIYTLRSGLENLMPLSQFIVAKDAFSMDHPMVVVNRYNSYYEYFLLTTNSDNSWVYDFYFSDLGFIKKLTEAFKERAKTIIAEADKNRLKLPCEYAQTFNISDAHNICYENLRKKVIAGLSIASDCQEINTVSELSPRQKECLTYYLRGYSAKEIANTLNLSYRTVEYYLHTIRVNSSCHSKYDLRKKYDNLLPETSFT